jgi:hypothetical protein
MPLFRSAILFLLSLTISFASGLTFEENRGQTSNTVKFLAKAQYGQIFFTRDAVIVHRTGSPDAVAIHFENSTAAEWEPTEPTGETTSYFIGRDPSKYVRNTPSYHRLTRRNIYPGIDAVFYSSEGKLEYDLVLSPQSNPDEIRIRVTGAHALSLDASGDLVAATADGEFRQRKPALYQMSKDGAKHPIEGHFQILAHDLVGFRAGARDPHLPLFIDPVLDSSTYLGGSGDDTVFWSDGTNSAGTTTSSDFPGAPIGRRNGTDIFVKIGLRSYIIGGSGNQTVTCVVPSYDGIWVGGYTDSQDLPTESLPLGINQAIPWQTDFAGGKTDGFVLFIAKPLSSRLTWLSYLGTPGDDQVTALSPNDDFNTILAAGSTTGRGFPGSSFFVAPTSTGPTGGVDIFLFYSAFIGLPGIDFPIYNTYYFGGTGDDRPFAITSFPDSTFINNFYAVVGETSSPDFPQTSATPAPLNGPTDGFVMVLNSDFSLNSSILFGGSGTDRVTSVARAFDGIAIAGTTSSQDLPLLNAAQPTFGGGNTDGFIAHFNLDLSQMLSSTYVGGSGDDQIQAMTSDYLGSIFVGGSTSSRDFPVTPNAIQPAYGGGATDGFLLHYHADGSLHHATYFGGSGDDQVLGLYTPGDFSVCLGGGTTSPDLPLISADQPALRGNTDGFVACISAALLGLPPIANAKDVRLEQGIRIGQLSGSYNATITVTSSDPDTVQVASLPTDAGAVATTVSAQPEPSQAGWDYFFVDCLTDSGGADLLLSAPGYTSQTTHVSCYPLTLYPSLPQAFPVGSNNVPLNISGARVSVSLGLPVQVSAFPYLGGGAPRPGAAPVTVQVVNSNPAVGTLSTTSLTLNPLDSGGAPSDSGMVFHPVAYGTTDLTFSSPFPLTPSDITVSVVSPIQQQPSSLTVPMGFQRSIFVRANGYPQTPVTATSSDATKVVVSPSSTAPGQASVTPQGGTVWVQALDSSGDVTLTLSGDGVGSTTTIVHLAMPVLRGNGASSIQIGVGETAYLEYAVSTSPTGTTGYTPNPGAGSLLSINNSDSTVVSLDSTQLQIKGLAVGSSTLTPIGVPGIPLDPATTPPVNVTVVAKPAILNGIELGKDQMASMNLIIPASVPNGTAITISSSDPTRVLLSPDTRSPGNALISIKSNFQLFFSFYVQALASSGQVQVTASIAGIGQVSAMVTLDPSGFGWGEDQISGPLSTIQVTSIYIIPFALDPTTLIPIAQQSLRPGVPQPSFIINSSNPDVAAATWSALLNYVSINAKNPGTTMLSFNQPPGFTTPSIRQSLPLTVLPPPSN